MPAISVVLVVHNQLALTRACLESLRATTVPFDLCVVDNGSSDGTETYLHRGVPAPRCYHRNAENLGLIRALNQGARMAESEFLCFLHNDTEMREPRWLERLRAAVEAGPSVGLAGLYGARRVRRDGRYPSRTIVHCLDGSANLRSPVVEVAAVDGVCLFLRRALLESIGGFDEGYGFFHGYDRDLSFAVREAGWRCVAVDAPFVHRGGGTRTGESAPVPPAEDLVQRRAALRRFARKWRHRLPCDVRTAGERFADWLRPRRR
ncbi:MAG: glycosyltransferase family 2 protein [Candidatus Rokubacteria bacterium]|nr:glycosyltransferase family 2 protein [Candidatus Rokubacteria bacterium]